MCSMLQGSSHAKVNNITEILQSSIKKLYNNGRALLIVHNHIVRVMDNGKSVLWVLLDLSVTFDTVNHSILQRLHNYLIGTDNALGWS